MAKKTRKKSASKKKKKKSAAPARKKRKTVVKKKSRAAARKKPAGKSKGVIGTIVGAATAVVDTLTDAERMHHKMEPHVPPDPE